MVSFIDQTFLVDSYFIWVYQEITLHVPDSHFTGTNGSGELTILHSPDSLKFSGSDGFRESLLQDVFSAALGMTISEVTSLWLSSILESLLHRYVRHMTLYLFEYFQDSEWTGLYIKDPFSLPEAVVEVHVDGIPNFGKVWC